MMIQYHFMQAIRKDVESNARPWEDDLDKAFPPFQIQKHKYSRELQVNVRVLLFVAQEFIWACLLYICPPQGL